MGVNLPARGSEARLQPSWPPPNRITVPTDVNDWEARLAADDDLIRFLAWEGYEGVEAEKLYKALMEYGHQVIGAWICTAVILSKCREKGVKVPDTLDPILVQEAHEREDLTANTIARAVVAFRDKVLKRGKWTASRGATLKTFFIGQALFRFATEYRDWLKERRRRLPTVPIEPRTAPDELHAGAEAIVVARETLRLSIDEIGDPIVRQMAVLSALGYTHREIAELLELGSSKVVETRLYRLRKREDRNDAA